jgi:hypothetical protein
MITKQNILTCSVFDYANSKNVNVSDYNLVGVQAKSEEEDFSEAIETFIRRLPDKTEAVADFVFSVVRTVDDDCDYETYILMAGTALIPKGR